MIGFEEVSLCLVPSRLVLTYLPTYKYEVCTFVYPDPVQEHGRSAWLFAYEARPMRGGLCIHWKQSIASIAIPGTTSYASYSTGLSATPYLDCHIDRTLVVRF